ncbi:FtsK/SpoIIIE domain-containing protein [Streptomyces albireticuli]|uniref:FtsK/SpoIIIE domain-containing protein n=2 Tax=Streptomyces albireticuli TaxID=1940 RepID=UPI001E534197|nr:FtsK/SpoIIIE domain-containing protein [Streptomyces albireticuli]MCD9145830.1 FHA domain-containing protein [Streptomyces albireticuli]MCD9165960.1 FHA domain-containing protein [Streptomyces albireticuli]MCD9196168.1 FHA domain-containing protein [Streptomyces albireticuli]
MQIRLTVLGPLSGHTTHTTRACDVLVTAPAGTALASVTSGLATAVAAAGCDLGSGTAVVYAGAERLDAQRRALGEPPLIDGAVLSLNAPAGPERHAGAPLLSGDAEAAVRLHVVSGPDAGGVHLLHGGEVHVGRSTAADIPLDDPDVSRLHCAVTLAEDGTVTVRDLGSTNGTVLAGERVTGEPVALPSGGLLRVGESVLALHGARDENPPVLPAVPDGEGHLRVGPVVTPPAGPLAPPARGPWLGAPPQAREPGRTSSALGTAGFPVPDPLFGDDPVTHGGRGVRLSPEAPPGRPAAAPDPLPAPAGPADGEPARRRNRGIGAWARRLTGGRGAADRAPAPGEWPEDGAATSETARAEAAALRERWPDPAGVLLTALGPGPRLWERGPDHPDLLTVRLGTADRYAPDGSALAAVPVTVGLRQTGSLGLAGPRGRLSGLARSVLAQLAALHSPAALEFVLISADRARTPEERLAEWSWLGWLPQLRPVRGQDCKLLTAYDREQAVARTSELVRRLEEGPLGPHWAAAPAAAVAHAAERHTGPRTVLIVDGDPGSADLRETVARLAAGGPAAGIHLLCLAEAPATTPASPVSATLATARAAAPAFPHCGAVALLSGDVATVVQVIHRAPAAAPGDTAGGPVPGQVYERSRPDGAYGQDAAFPGPGTPGTALDTRHAPHPGPYGPPGAGAPDPYGLSHTGPAEAGATAGPGLQSAADRPADGADGSGTAVVAAVDAVSAAWAERFARALAPLRMSDAAAGTASRVAAALPRSARLLDELGLARATPASLTARWAAATDRGARPGGRAVAVLGAGPHGPLAVDLAADGPHLLVEGGTGSGKSELLRSLAASLAAADRPDRLSLVLVDGAGAERGEGLRLCTDLPHVSTYLAASDPVRMREFAQALSSELKRRAELLGRLDFTAWHTQHAAVAAAQVVAPRRPMDAAGDLDSLPTGTLKLRTQRDGPSLTAETALPRLVVLVDDFDALVAPALGSTGRPAAGSVVRALEAVARDGERLGVHLVAASGRPERTADTAAVERAGLRAMLEIAPPSADGGAADGSGAGEPAPGRGRLMRPDDDATTPFQAGRVTGRIPRTATLRPTVVALDWQRMGDPPTRRPVRELGNGPTDLALLASALQRAAQSAGAEAAPPLL